MAECRIPGHITVLYIFAVVNLCAMLNISLVSAEVYVIDTVKNVTVDTIRDKQAMFGPDFPDDGLVGRLMYVLPHDACNKKKLEPPPYESDLPWIALIARGPCHFDLKVLNVQSVGFSAAIVHNYEDNNALMPMGGDSAYADQVKIPSIFVGYSNGMDLARRYNYTRKEMVIKIVENSDDTPANFFLPFVVVVSICFFGVIIFSIVKCIRYIQHVRRTRLSKSALKKIPTRKYKKGDHYDTCAICLEDYEEGEKLRVLPCDHTYHCKCIDPWLTKRKKTCPQCKRRVIPGHDTDSESEDEEQGTAETTPLLRNNNNGRRPGNLLGQSAGPSGRASHGTFAGTSRSRTSTFERSGLPEAAEPDVVVISHRQPAVTAATTATVVVEDDEDGDTDSEGEMLEGAVGGVGISDHLSQAEEALTNILVDVEPVPNTQQRSESPNTQDASASRDSNAPQDSNAPERFSPARAQGSINGAFSGSTSSDDDDRDDEADKNGERDGDASRRGKKKKKKSRKSNVVV